MGFKARGSTARHALGPCHRFFRFTPYAGWAVIHSIDRSQGRVHLIIL